jgi:hypothetical protein
MELEYRFHQNSLAGIDLDGLDFAEERRLGVNREMQVGYCNAGPPLTRNALFHFSFERVAVVLVRRNVNEARLGIVGLVRPVLAAPEAGAFTQGG